MLDSEQSIKVWYKLTEQQYPIEKITITTYDNFSHIEIIFTNLENLDKFRELIFNFMQKDISSLYHINYLTLFVKIDLDFLEKIVYPKFTKEINIFNCLSYNDKIINLGVLPSKLEKLIIISSAIFDLTNLPSQLKFLDLLGCTGFKKFNLDYLPESLEILKLSYVSEQNGKKSIYVKKDIENLPTNLKEIYIDNMFFNSVKDVLLSYQI